jgi:hypothetical protein
MGVHYKSLWCTFMAWINEPHSPHVYRMLMSWLVEETKKIKVSKEESQLALEEAK